jgi:hypothetical protein
MKKKSFGLIIVFLFLLFTVHFANAVEFGQHSAIITNSYWPRKVGDRIIKVHNEINNKRNFIYDDAVQIEKIDGVNCMRLTIVDTFNSWFTSIWVAQDISGNVYILKVYDTETHDPIIFGKDSPVLLFPGVVQVGDVLAAGSETVVEVGVSVDRLGTGLGPFTNCIKTVQDDGDFVYYAPNVGEVKKESVAIEINWELKEIINVKSKTVVVPLL